MIPGALYMLQHKNPGINKIQPVVQDELSFEAIVEDARHTIHEERRTTHDRHPTFTMANHEPLAQVSSNHLSKSPF